EYVPSFEEIKDKVKARWLFEKAKPLAEEEAKRVAAAVPKNSFGEDAGRFLRDASKYGSPVIELDRVARLVPPRPAVPSRGGAGSYELYRVPESKVEHPSSEMVDKLIGLQTEGEAVVVSDQPRDHYYVAVLKYRAPVYQISFFVDAARPEAYQTLIGRFEVETQQREKQRQSFLEQLRAEAGLKIDEEKIKDTAPGQGD